jgi:hypothetical protein
MDKERRLRDLEASDASQHPTTPPGGARREPTHDEQQRALRQSWEAYYEVWLRHGFTRAEVDAQLAWDKELDRRVRESGMERWEVIRDMCEYVDSLNLPLDQTMAAFDDYPGPGYRGRGGANDQMRLQ